MCVGFGKPTNNSAILFRILISLNNCRLETDSTSQPTSKGFYYLQILAAWVKIALQAMLPAPDPRAPYLDPAPRWKRRPPSLLHPLHLGSPAPLHIPLPVWSFWAPGSQLKAPPWYRVWTSSQSDPHITPRSYASFPGQILAPMELHHNCWEYFLVMYFYNYLVIATALVANYALLYLKNKQWYQYQYLSSSISTSIIYIRYSL